MWQKNSYITDEYGEKIPLHSPEDFIGMRRAGRLAAQTLDHVEAFIKPGVSTERLNQVCHEFIVSHGAIPAPLNYKGFPKSVCTSVNHVVCHGIPNAEKVLQKGDIINIDVTVIVDGWHGDTNRTFPVGNIGVKARKLVDATYESMMRGIEVVKPGATLGDIGWAIESFVEKKGYSVVQDFCGHGIGRKFHAPPNVLHFGQAGAGLVLQEGMFFTIEPMINVGDCHVKVLRDGWTAVTRDRSLSAQFEHSLGVTADGYEIFTLSE